MAHRFMSSKGLAPSVVPTAVPSAAPSLAPSVQLTATPGAPPSLAPGVAPTAVPRAAPFCHCDWVFATCSLHQSLFKAAYESLGLQTFYTSGPTETRPWTIPCGATAPELRMNAQQTTPIPNPQETSRVKSKFFRMYSDDSSSDSDADSSGDKSICQPFVRVLKRPKNSLYADDMEVGMSIRMPRKYNTVLKIGNPTYNRFLDRIENVADLESLSTCRKKKCQSRREKQIEICNDSGHYTWISYYGHGYEEPILAIVLDIIGNNRVRVVGSLSPPRICFCSRNQYLFPGAVVKVVEDNVLGLCGDHSPQCNKLSTDDVDYYVNSRMKQKHSWSSGTGCPLLREGLDMILNEIEICCFVNRHHRLIWDSDDSNEMDDYMCGMCSHLCPELYVALYMDFFEQSGSLNSNHLTKISEDLFYEVVSYLSEPSLAVSLVKSLLGVESRRRKRMVVLKNRPHLCKYLLGLSK